MQLSLLLSPLKLLVLLGLSSICTGLSAQPELSWSAGHANALIPGQSVSAGYLSITNAGDEDDRLISLSTEAAAMVQVHESAMSDGMMTMRHIESLLIPAGETIEFQPGGLHLMIMGVDQEAFSSDSIDLQLSFESGAVLSVSLPIKSMLSGHH
ncbi:MAG: copper chaperone PCu(A)C [Porticoccaceae bacterium]|jgi:periplasmic copper chaperone A|nr:copper chaperone PCu(A)C [Porticoccaceae bacterium]